MTTADDLLNIHGVTHVEQNPFTWCDFEIMVKIGTSWEIIEQIKRRGYKPYEFGDARNGENSILLVENDSKNESYQ